MFDFYVLAEKVPMFVLLMIPGYIMGKCKLLDGKADKSICSIAESCDNHMIAFAAEESRLTGTVVDMREFEKKFDPI